MKEVRKISEKASSFFCPACDQKKSLGEVSIFINSCQKLIEGKMIWYTQSVDELIGRYTRREGYYNDTKKWACDDCVRNELVLPSFIEKQLFCDWLPFLVYMDINKVCHTCREEFIFTKQEQQYWFEELGFWVQSDAKNCGRCRMKKRENRAVQVEIQNLTIKEDKTPEEFEHLISFYGERNNLQKLGFYKNQYKKLVEKSRNIEPNI